MTIWFEVKDDPDLPPVETGLVDAEKESYFDVYQTPKPSWFLKGRTLNGWFAMEDLEPFGYETMKKLYDECSGGVDQVDPILFRSMDALDRFREEVELQRSQISGLSPFYHLKPPKYPTATEAAMDERNHAYWGEIRAQQAKAAHKERMRRGASYNK